MQARRRVTRGRDGRRAEAKEEGDEKERGDSDDGNSSSSNELNSQVKFGK
jgi:hypothetical protein